MTSIEQTGKNFEEATQIALQKLGVTEDEVDVEILDEGSKGFLGIGSTPAKVRVTVRKVEAAPKLEAAKPRPRRRPRPRVKPKAEAKPVQESNIPIETAPEVQEQPVSKPVEAAAPAASQEEIRAAGDIACEVLQRILDGIGAGGKVVVREVNASQASLDVQGGDAAVLIGKHGQTINSLQYLTTVIMNKRTGLRIRVNVDVEGYRNRREEALKSQALYLASQVKKTGQEAVLDPLAANERRIVHATLADDQEVYTYSEGQDPDRHVVISPKK